MRNLLLILATALCSGAPLTFSAAGAASQITGGWFVDLVDTYGTANDRIATFTATEPILGVQFYANNAPYDPGSGWKFWINGTLVLDTGVGNLVQGTLEFAAAQPFTTVTVTTNFEPGYRERGLLIDWVGTPAQTAPEPSTWMLLGAIVSGLVFGRFLRGATHEQAE